MVFRGELFRATHTLQLCMVSAYPLRTRVLNPAGMCVFRARALDPGQGRFIVIVVVMEWRELRVGVNVLWSPVDVP